MDKEIALAVNFAKAPKELQDAAKAQFDIDDRIVKIQAEIERLQKELQAAVIEQGTKAKELRAQLTKWTPPEGSAVIDAQIGRG